MLTASEFAHATEPPTVTDPATILIDVVSGFSRTGGAATDDEVRLKPDTTTSMAPRPSGRRFGILVHALLAAVPLDAKPQDVRDLAEVQARILGATDDERAEAAAIADRVLRHPIAAAARAAQAAGRAVRREAPVSIVVPAFARSSSDELRRGEPGLPAVRAGLVDGQIDLAYDDGEGWVVVDFKTDAEIAGSEEVYRRQVALYVDAIARATNRPARGVLLRV